MNNEQTNETNGQGKENNNAMETSSQELTAMEKLKAANDEMEKEIQRNRELQKEQQEIEAQKLLSGTTGGEVKAEPKIISDEDYAKSILNGEVPDGE